MSASSDGAAAAPAAAPSVAAPSLLLYAAAAPLLRAAAAPLLPLAAAAASQQQQPGQPKACKCRAVLCALAVVCAAAAGQAAARHGHRPQHRGRAPDVGVFSSQLGGAHVLEQAERADISPELRDAVRANPSVDWIDVPPPAAAAAGAQSNEQQLQTVRQKKAKQDPCDRARDHPLEVWQSFLGGRELAAAGHSR